MNSIESLLMDLDTELSKLDAINSNITTKREQVATLEIEEVKLLADASVSDDDKVGQLLSLRARRDVVRASISRDEHDRNIQEETTVLSAESAAAEISTFCQDAFAERRAKFAELIAPYVTKDHLPIALPLADAHPTHRVLGGFAHFHFGKVELFHDQYGQQVAN